MSIIVRDQPEQHRYEADLDGQIAGFVTYRARPGLIALIHTEVDPAFEGQGVGSTLIGQTLDDARARHLAVLPFCPFVLAYIQRHTEYVDLVPDHYRPTFGL
jgi:uncharacterized protein